MPASAATPLSTPTGKRLGRRAALAGTALAGSLAALGALAQPLAAQTSDAVYLGEIVFSFGLPRVAIDTPQSVTVLEQDDIDQEVAATVAEAIEDVPGVSVAGGGSALGQAFNIRGIGLTEQTASEARIIVEVDGAPKFYEQYRMGSFFSDLELYRRVEVLRGPASSTLYGSGALGGVIAFETKDAADFLEEGETQGGRARLGFGSNGGEAFGSVIAANDFGALETLVSFNTRTADDYEDGDGVEVLASGGDSASGLVKGTWRLPGEQVVRLSYQLWDSTLDDAPLAATGGGDVVPVFGTTDRHTRDATAILAWENPVPGNDWLDLSAQVSFSSTEVAQRDHQNDPAGGFPIACAPGTFQVVCDADYAYHTTNASLENSAAFGAGAWDLFLTTGIEFTRIDRQAQSEVGDLAFHPEGTDDKLGLYAQAELVWADRLTLIPGLRADFVSRQPSDTIPGAEDVEDVAVSPKLAALYELGRGLSVFGSVARTERLPTLDELYSYSATQGPAVDLEAETALNTEIGLAGEHLDVFAPGDALTYKLTLFRNDVEDLIQRTASSQPLYFENVAEARFEGLELEGGYETGRFFARVAYAQIDAEDTTYGYTLTSNPADSLVLTVGGRAPSLGLEYGWRGRLAQDITTESRSTASGVITPTEYEGYVTHDLFLTWAPSEGRLADLRIDATIENVTDETWRNNLATDNGPGRSIELAVAYTF